MVVHIEYQDFVVDIDFADGMNISFLSWKGHTLVKLDEERRMKGLTYGIPIMFPTPNRTCNDRFLYQGKYYTTKMHGLVRHIPFQIIENGPNNGAYHIVGQLHWNPQHEDFHMYPFECKLKITLVLDNNGIYYNYEIINLSSVTMPYGFGIHPFFYNEKGDACVQLRTNKALEALDMINTGEIYSTYKSEEDLSEFKFVKDLKLDTVFYFPEDRNNGLEKIKGSGLKEKAIIKWSDYQMSIQCSEDFSHMIVYTPSDGLHICVEPQTCSIDAINLFSKGYKEVSGLIETMPHEMKNGIIYMEMCLN